MHAEVLNFVSRIKRSFEAAFAVNKVLEAGSLDVNGSVRQFFPMAREYMGIDWRPGPGVEVVSLMHEYRGRPDGYFDFVISTEMLEHDPHWEASLNRMMDLLAPGGTMLVTCAGPGRNPHRLETAPGGTHYKNMTMGELATGIFARGGFKAARFEEDEVAHDMRFFGWRKR